MLTEKDIETLRNAQENEVVMLDDGTKLVKMLDDCSCENCYVNSQGQVCKDMNCVVEKEGGAFRTYQFHLFEDEFIKDFIVKHLLYQSTMRGYWRIKLYEGYWKNREDAINYAMKVISECPVDCEVQQESDKEVM